MTWRDDKTTAERGYGGRWQRARAVFLRSNPLCVHCQREGRVTAATLVDHRIPHRGDMALFWDQTNWDALCSTHHSSDKQMAERSGRRRRLRFDAAGNVLWDD